MTDVLPKDFDILHMATGSQIGPDEVSSISASESWADDQITRVFL